MNPTNAHTSQVSSRVQCPVHVVGHDTTRTDYARVRMMLPWATSAPVGAVVLSAASSTRTKYEHKVQQLLVQSAPVVRSRHTCLSININSSLLVRTDNRDYNSSRRDLNHAYIRTGKN